MDGDLTEMALGIGIKIEKKATTYSFAEAQGKVIAQIEETFGLIDVHIKKLEGVGSIKLAKKTVECIVQFAKKKNKLAVTFVISEEIEKFLHIKKRVITYQEYKTFKQIFVFNTYRDRYLHDIASNGWESIENSILGLHVSIDITKKRDKTYDLSYNPANQAVEYYIKGEKGEVFLRISEEQGVELHWLGRRFPAGNTSDMMHSLNEIVSKVLERRRIKNELNPPKEHFQRLIRKLGLNKSEDQLYQDLIKQIKEEEELEEVMAVIHSERRYKKVYDSKKWELTVYYLEIVDAYIFHNRTSEKSWIEKKDIPKKIEEELINIANRMIKDEMSKYKFKS